MTSEKLKYIETLAIELYKQNPGITDEKVLKAIALDMKAGYDPNQPRDESGKWGDGSPDVEKDLEKEYPDLTIDIYQDDKRGVLTLSRVVVPEDKRGEGLGSSFMESLTAQADKMSYSIILTPSGDFGGDVDRLKEFYQRYGFIFNKGEDRDFSHREDMYRLPQKTKAGFDPNQPRDASGQWGSGNEKKPDEANTDYRGGHYISEEYSVSLDDLLAGDMSPSDIYDGLHYYNYSGGLAGDQSMAAILAARGKPEMLIDIYRAVPGNVGQINNGDWISLSEAYADQHRDSKNEWSENKDWKVIVSQVPVKHVRWDANDLNEFAYFK